MVIVHKLRQYFLSFNNLRACDITFLSPNALNYIKLHYITVHYNTLYYITFTFQCIILQYNTF